MSRGTRTLGLFLVLVALGAYIWFVERKREPANPDAKAKVFASLESASIQEMTLRSSKGETTTVKKDGSAWRVTAPVTAEADAGEVSGLTSALAGLEQQSKVEQPGVLKEYGLDPAKFEVTFTASGQPARRLLLGDKTPTGADLYAKLADAGDVFLVQGFLESTFDRGTFDLRDKTALKFERDKVGQVDVRSASGAASFTKSGDDWRMTAPVAARADTGAVEGLVGRLATLQMKGITAQHATDLKAYGLDTPAFSVDVTAGSAKTTLLVGAATGDGARFAKDAARPIVFTVDGTLADDLGKKPEDYRRKDLFAFRTFTGARLEVSRDGATVVFEKQKGSGATPDKWVQAQPKKDAEETKIIDALSAITNLRAQTFVDALPAGAAQVAQVKAAYGEPRQEDVITLFKANDEYFATRPGDPGAAKLAGTDVPDALKTLDALK